MFVARKSRIMIGLAGASLALSACGGVAGGSGSGGGGTVEIRATNLLPPNGAQSDMIQWFMDELGSRTDGEVKTEVVYGGALLAGTDTLPGMKQGRAEAGNVVPAYFPAELPLNNVNMVPIAGADQSARLRALQDLNDDVEAFADEFAAQDLVLIGFLPNASSTVAFNKEVSSLADLKGAKVRAPSQPQSVVYEELGAEPVFMPSEEVYEAIERGIVDGVTYPMDTQVANGITDVADYMAPDVGQNGGSIFALSKAAYDELPDDAKDVVEELKGEWYAKTDEMLAKYESQACEEFTANGGTIVRWSDEDAATIADAVDRLADEVWASEAEKSVDASVVDEVWTTYNSALEEHTGETEYTDVMTTCGQ
ncbi:TRAP-type C4-dicarboxylate transport system substrate-binding protein [Nocardioides cavernae]|uniref:TRAP-type C4-dicarboxylate transport system substrate-binding protein n=1 Tax=Nocardioides cavernae TaxID=1921566 RepID=A0A7Y9H0Q4_9ACTN|nr:C4-dicarboxylate TRAP transporter substrate-binding protein [Nocardioides cavernae]NYE35840.1 TRAP-type C4-dicarboxylate transport system substrate-binding protein [Nocardioides cavernae]